jgi:hypothetical protein
VWWWPIAMAGYVNALKLMRVCRMTKLRVRAEPKPSVAAVICQPASPTELRFRVVGCAATVSKRSRGTGSSTIIRRCGTDENSGKTRCVTPINDAISRCRLRFRDDAING